jgi:HEAT repeat protein
MKRGRMQPGIFRLALVTGCLLIGAGGCGLAAQTEPAEDDQWIVVSSVAEEYTYVGEQRCECGGSYEVVVQSTGESEGKHFDKLFVTCKKCGKQRTFTFDVTSLFEQYELAGSEDAKKKAFAELNTRYPEIASEQLPEFVKLLEHRNPHFRRWAVEALAKLGTPEAITALLDGYLRYPVEINVDANLDYSHGLKKLGLAVLPAVADRLRSSDQKARWGLVFLLREIRDPKSREIIERELREGSARNRRICYVSLGELGYKQSEPILRRSLRRESMKPDDGLLWALGRCGTKDSIRSVRRYSKADDVNIRAAALVALGALGDRQSIPHLIDIAVKDPNEDIRHTAIHALGLLRAKEAVPALIVCLEKEDPDAGDAFKCWPGIYGDDPDGYYGPEGLIEVTLRALARIGDARATSAFEKVLRDDRYDFYFEEVVEAAASLGWRELVPAIIDRLGKDRFSRKKEYSPALRRLTGQNFGELDLKSWRTWLKTPPSPDDKPYSHGMSDNAADPREIWFYYKDAERGVENGWLLEATKADGTRLRYVDADGDGKVEYKEVVVGGQATRQPATTEIQKEFDYYYNKLEGIS